MSFDVEVVRVAVVQEEPRLAFRLGFDEARDVFECREMVLGQFPADVSVIGIRLQEGRHIGTFGSRRNELAVFDVEPLAERIPDVKPGTVLEELGGVERLSPGPSGRGGGGLEEPCFTDDRIAGTQLLQDGDGGAFDFGLELVAPFDDLLGALFVEGHLRKGRTGRRYGRVFEEALQLLFLVLRDRLSRHRSLLFKVIPICRESGQKQVLTCNL